MSKIPPEDWLSFATWQTAFFVIGGSVVVFCYTWRTVTVARCDDLLAHMDAVLEMQRREHAETADTRNGSWTYEEDGGPTSLCPAVGRAEIAQYAASALGAERRESGVCDTDNCSDSREAK